MAETGGYKMMTYTKAELIKLCKDEKTADKLLFDVSKIAKQLKLSLDKTKDEKSANDSFKFFAEKFKDIVYDSIEPTEREKFWGAVGFWLTPSFAEGSLSTKYQIEKNRAYKAADMLIKGELDPIIKAYKESSKNK